MWVVIGTTDILLPFKSITSELSFILLRDAKYSVTPISFLFKRVLSVGQLINPTKSLFSTHSWWAKLIDFNTNFDEFFFGTLNGFL